MDYYDYYGLWIIMIMDYGYIYYYVIMIMVMVIIIWTPDYGYGGGVYLKNVACLVPLCSLHCISLWAILNKEESEEENRFLWVTLTDTVNCGFVKHF